MENDKFAWKELFFLFLILGIGIFFVVATTLTKLESVSLSPPGVEYESHSMKTNYQAEDIISGKLNLTLNNALGNYVITTNINNDNITLLDFLEANAADYECSTSNCLDDYSSDGIITSLNVDSNGKIAGYIISGESISQVSSAKLTLNSNAAPSCGFSQLKIDPLANGENLIVNNDNSSNICQTVYTGCFNINDSTSEVEIDNNRYCEKILLPAAPGYRLQAKIKNSTQGDGDLEMELYPLSDLGSPAGKCDLPEHTQNDQNLRCIVNYPSAEPEEYYVCVRKKDSGNSNYKIKFETVNVCGTNSIGGFGNDIADYEITARALEFGNINDFKVHESFLESYSFDLADYFSTYISGVYNGECTPNCAIPIEFRGETQNLLFSDVEIKYTAQQGTITNNDFHRLEVTPVTLSSDEIELALENLNFKIPSGSNENKFKLFINGELVFEENIQVAESFTFNVNPKFVAFGEDVLFYADTNYTINSSTWDFGDGVEETINGKQIRHRYTEAGQNTFNMEVSLLRNDGVRSTKTFTITVGDAKEIANYTIDEYKNRIITLNSQVNQFPQWVKDGITKNLDIVSLNSTLNAIENDYEIALTDDEYESIMLRLINLKIPKSINATKDESGIPLLIGFENADISYIEEISGTTVTETSSLESNIGAWTNEYFDPTISYQEISAVYDDGSEALLSKFTIDTSPVKESGYDSYLIIGYDIESGGKFATSYNQKTIGGSGTYIALLSGQEDKSIEFYILGEIAPEELGAYISPEISVFGDLSNEISPCNFNNLCEEGEDTNNCPADCGKGRWGWFVFWIIILFFIALAMYITLQEWYRRNYENHLFKKKDDLYNLINYVYNARKAGIPDNQSKEGLRKSGWDGEKVRYIYRKIDGKRTGLYEIPLLKFMENRKVKREIAKRQGGKVDARFIKRPSFNGLR